MKTTVVRYGLFAAVSLILFFLVTWLIFRSNEDYTVQEIFGYAGMVLALSFVYFGIRHYRDHVNHGQLTFGKGMKLGLMITLIPALAFGLFDIFYVMYLEPDFLNKYYAAVQLEMKQTLNAADYQQKIIQMEAEKAMFNNKAVQFLVMALTVFLIGVIMTVLSTLILKKKNAAL